MRTYLREAEVTYRRSKRLPDIMDRRVKSSRDVAPLIQRVIGSRITESFIVLALSAKHEVIGYHEVARGGVASCPLLPGDVFRYPLIAGAVSIIVAHNHPSGDTSPSVEDRACTERIVSAGKLLGVQCLDHLVVTEDKYFSFLDSGVMPSSHGAEVAA